MTVILFSSSCTSSARPCCSAPAPASRSSCCWGIFSGKKPAVIAGIARIVVIADFVFTATAVILQPVTGILLVR